MDIKEKIEEVVNKLKNNPKLLQKFEKEPVKVLEELLGVDLPDDTVAKIVEGVKAKMTADKLSDGLGALKKLF